MGLFDFLKSNKRRNAQPENIDEIFDLASKDVAYRPLFYRTILEMDLYLLVNPVNNIPYGKFTADKNTQIEVKTWDDGRVPVFTSIDKIFENGVIKEQETYVAMNGRAIFEMFTEPTTFLLNPYSRPSKEFLPSEIRRLITGEFYKPDEERKMKADSVISIGIPSNYPTALIETLKKYCNTREEIKGAYVALMHDSKSGEAPHLLIGLDVIGNLQQIFGEVGETLKPHLQQGEPVDMISVSDDGQMSKTLKQNDYKVY